MHKPFHIHKLSLIFSEKSCFQDFSTHINYGSRIGIIGRNGTGKSALLNLISGQLNPTSGTIIRPVDSVISYVPQLISWYQELSGGERFMKSFIEALNSNPDILLLDEPTNHLDQSRRAHLFRLLKTFPGTLMFASHDIELLQAHADTLWHLESGKIHITTDTYTSYMQTIQIERRIIESKLSMLDRQKALTHTHLMREQSRASKSKARGEKSVREHKWTKIVGSAKASQAESTSGRKQAAIFEKKQALAEQLSNLYLPEIIVPTFTLQASSKHSSTLIHIRNGSVQYLDQPILVDNLNMTVGSTDRLVIQGANGTGKSTIVKAILRDPQVVTSGSWHLSPVETIGYLDQHYKMLGEHHSVLEFIGLQAPTLSHAELRKHLNRFLFRKNFELDTCIANLSGGERARLSLACIGLKTPRLLILDEITNNLDLETKTHVIQVLKVYPGAMILISHDRHFINQIGITDTISL